MRRTPEYVRLPSLIVPPLRLLEPTTTISCIGFLFVAMTKTLSDYNRTMNWERPQVNVL